MLGFSFSLFLCLSFFGFIKRFVLSIRENKSLIFFFSVRVEKARWEYLLSNICCLITSVDVV